MSFCPSITAVNADIFLFVQEQDLSEDAGPEVTGTFQGVLQFSDMIRCMLPCEKELKIKMCFSCFLTLAVQLHGRSFFWWEQRSDGKHKEVLTVKVSNYLPFPYK